MKYLDKWMSRYRRWLIHKGLLQGAALGIALTGLVWLASGILLWIMIPAAAVAGAAVKLGWNRGREAWIHDLDQRTGMQQRLITLHEYQKAQADNPFLGALSAQVRGRLEGLQPAKVLPYRWLPEGALVIMLASALGTGVWFMGEGPVDGLTVFEERARQEDELQEEEPSETAEEADMDEEQDAGLPDDLPPSEDTADRDIMDQEDTARDAADDLDRSIARDRAAREVEEETRELRREERGTGDDDTFVAEGEALEGDEMPSDGEEGEEAEVWELDEGEGMDLDFGDNGERDDMETEEEADNGAADRQEHDAAEDNGQPEDDFDDETAPEPDADEAAEEFDDAEQPDEEVEEPDGEAERPDGEGEESDPADGADEDGAPGDGHGDDADGLDAADGAVDDEETDYYSAQLEGALQEGEWMHFLMDELAGFDEDRDPQELEERFLEYRSELLSQIGRESIPVRYRDWIRDYFSLITAN